MQKFTNDELQQKTEQWSADRLITVNGNSLTQYAKLSEESGELAAGLVRNKPDEIKDAIGDMLVVLTNIAVLEGTSLNECWNLAYDEIKDRKGKLLENGNFVKESDFEACN